MLVDNAPPRAARAVAGLRVALQPRQQREDVPLGSHDCHHNRVVTAGRPSVRWLGRLAKRLLKAGRRSKPSYSGRHS